MSSDDDDDAMASKRSQQAATDLDKAYALKYRQKGAVPKKKNPYFYLHQSNDEEKAEEADVSGGEESVLGKANQSTTLPTTTFTDSEQDHVANTAQLEEIDRPNSSSSFDSNDLSSYDEGSGMYNMNSNARTILNTPIHYPLTYAIDSDLASITQGLRSSAVTPLSRSQTLQTTSPTPSTSTTLRHQQPRQIYTVIPRTTTPNISRSQNPLLFQLPPVDDGLLKMKQSRPENSRVNFQTKIIKRKKLERRRPYTLESQPNDEGIDTEPEEVLRNNRMTDTDVGGFDELSNIKLDMPRGFYGLPKIPTTTNTTNTTKSGLVDLEEDTTNTIKIHDTRMAEGDEEEEKECVHSASGSVDSEEDTTSVSGKSDNDFSFSLDGSSSSSSCCTSSSDEDDGQPSPKRRKRDSKYTPMENVDARVCKKLSLYVESFKCRRGPVISEKTLSRKIAHRFEPQQKQNKKKKKKKRGEDSSSKMKVVVVDCHEDWVPTENALSVLIRANDKKVLDLFTKHDEVQTQRWNDMITKILKKARLGEIEENIIDKVYKPFALRGSLCTKGIYWPRDSVLDLKCSPIRNTVFVFRLRQVEVQLTTPVFEGTMNSMDFKPSTLVGVQPKELDKDMAGQRARKRQRHMPEPVLEKFFTDLLLEAKKRKIQLETRYSDIVDELMNKFEGNDFTKNPFGMMDPFKLDFDKVKSQAEAKRREELVSCLHEMKELMRENVNLRRTKSLGLVGDYLRDNDREFDGKYEWGQQHFKIKSAHVLGSSSKDMEVEEDEEPVEEKEGEVAESKVFLADAKITKINSDNTLVEQLISITGGGGGGRGNDDSEEQEDDDGLHLTFQDRKEIIDRILNISRSDKAPHLNKIRHSLEVELLNFVSGKGLRSFGDSVHDVIKKLVEYKYVISVSQMSANEQQKAAKLIFRCKASIKDDADAASRSDPASYERLQNKQQQSRNALNNPTTGCTVANSLFPVIGRSHVSTIYLCDTCSLKTNVGPHLHQDLIINANELINNNYTNGSSNNKLTTNACVEKEKNFYNQVFENKTPNSVLNSLKFIKTGGGNLKERLSEQDDDDDEENGEQQQQLSNSNSKFSGYFTFKPNINNGSSDLAFRRFFYDIGDWKKNAQLEYLFFENISEFVPALNVNVVRQVWNEIKANAVTDTANFPGCLAFISRQIGDNRRFQELVMDIDCWTKLICFYGSFTLALSSREPIPFNIEKVFQQLVEHVYVVFDHIFLMNVWWSRAVRDYMREATAFLVTTSLHPKVVVTDDLKERIDRLSLLRMIATHASYNGGRCQLFNHSPMFWFYIEPNVVPNRFNNSVFRFLMYGESFSRVRDIDSNELMTVKGRVAQIMKIRVSPQPVHFSFEINTFSKGLSVCVASSAPLNKQETEAAVAAVGHGFETNRDEFPAVLRQEYRPLFPIHQVPYTNVSVGVLLLTERYFQVSIQNASMVEHIQSMEEGLSDTAFNIRKKVFENSSSPSASSSNLRFGGSEAPVSQNSVSENEALVLGVEERCTMQYISDLVRGKANDMPNYLVGVFQPISSTFVGEALEAFTTNNINLVDAYHPELMGLYKLAVQIFLSGDSSAVNSAETVTSLASPSSSSSIEKSTSSNETSDSAYRHQLYQNQTTQKYFENQSRRTKNGREADDDNERFSHGMGYNNSNLIQWLKEPVGTFETMNKNNLLRRPTEARYTIVPSTNTLVKSNGFNTTSVGGIRYRSTMTANNLITASLMNLNNSKPNVWGRTSLDTIRATAAAAAGGGGGAARGNNNNLLQVGEFFVEDMRRFLTNDLHNIVMLILKRFYFTLNKSEIEVLTASAKQAAKILETSLNIAVDAGVANKVSNWIRTRKSLAGINLNILPDTRDIWGTQSNVLLADAQGEQVSVLELNSDTSRVGLQSFQKSFSASELNRKAQLPTRPTTSSSGNGGLIMCTNTMSVENDFIFVPSTLTESLNSLQFMRVKTLMAQNYDVIQKLKGASVLELENSKSSVITFRQNAYGIDMVEQNMQQQEEEGGSEKKSWFSKTSFNTTRSGGGSRNTIEADKIAKAVRNFSTNERILDQINQPFNIPMYMIYAVCRTLNDTDFYFKLPNIWRNFGYNNLNELLNLAFKLTLMPYADVINTNHSLINALNRFVRSNDKVGDIEMDLLFGNVLGEYRPTPQRQVFGEEEVEAATAGSGKEEEEEDADYGEAIDDNGEWCNRMYLPSLLLESANNEKATSSSSSESSNSLNNVTSNARFSLVSKPLNRAHSTIEELLCSISSSTNKN